MIRQKCGESTKYSAHDCGRAGVRNNLYKITKGFCGAEFHLGFKVWGEIKVSCTLNPSIKFDQGIVLDYCL